MNKLLCKNTLKGYNNRYTEIIPILTEGWYYEITEYPLYMHVAGNDNWLHVFRKDITDSEYLYIYDWFYSTAELRQKQIDSVINE
jgi:hypothetical protein